MIKLNLKTILLFSSTIAVALNVGQYLSSLHQRANAFAPAWAYADTKTVPSSPAPIVNSTAPASASRSS